MGWSNDTSDTIIVPAGATSGKRIEVDGVDGDITVYGDNENDFLSLDTKTGFPEIRFHSSEAADGNHAFITAGLGNMKTTGLQIQSTEYWNTISGKAVRGRHIAAANFTRSGIIQSGGIEDGGVFLADDATAKLRMSRDGVVKSQLSMTETGATLNGPLKQVKPDGTVEEWIDIPLMNGWTNRGGIGAKLSVRKAASPANSMLLVGHIISGDTTNGVQVGQLPPGYWPVSEQIILARKGGNTFPATVGVEPDGKIQIFDPPATGGLLQISPTTIALDK